MSQEQTTGDPRDIPITAANTDQVMGYMRPLTTEELDRMRKAGFWPQDSTREDIRELIAVADDVIDESNGLSEAQMLIREVCTEICDFLIEKNKAYGNSALTPIRIFSKAGPLKQIDVRIDDKLNRLMKGNAYPGDNDVQDLVGYLILRMVAEKMH